MALCDLKYVYLHVNFGSLSWKIFRRIVLSLLIVAMDSGKKVNWGY